MDDCYFSAEIGNEKTLFVAPLTDRRINMSGQSIADPSGYFLYEQRGTGSSAEVEILAHLVSEEAAFRLSELLGLR
jgi:hypothetical protein